MSLTDFAGEAVAAHASRETSFPAPGSTVGGHVSVVDIVFGQEIAALHLFQIESRDGSLLDGEPSQPFTNTIRFTLTKPLSSQGVYIARYTITATDGDTTPGGYAFTFGAQEQPGAAIDPSLYGSAVPLPESGSSRTLAKLLSFVAVAGGITLGLATSTARRLRNHGNK